MEILWKYMEILWKYMESTSWKFMESPENVVVSELRWIKMIKLRQVESFNCPKARKNVTIYVYMINNHLV